MVRQFDVAVEEDSAVSYVAHVPELPGCHTQAASLDDLTMRIREAIELCIEERGAPIDSLDFVALQRVTVEVCVTSRLSWEKDSSPRCGPWGSRWSGSREAITYSASPIVVRLSYRSTSGAHADGRWL